MEVMPGVPNVMSYLDSMQFAVVVGPTCGFSGPLE